MTDKKVSREGMLEWLGNWIRVCKSCGEKPCEAACSPSDVKQCRQAYAAIRSLILASDKGPEVSRGFVVNSARAMHVEPDALRICLEEAGVTVKERK